VEAALRESEDRHRAIANAASDAIVTIDQRSTILFINRAAEKIFGYPCEEMQGQKLTLLMPDSLRPLHEAALRRYVETHERHIAWGGVELTGLRKDGKLIPLEISFGESKRSGGLLFTGIVRDITERKRVEARLATQHAITEILAEHPSVDTAMPAILKTACEDLGWDLGQAWRVDRQADALRHAASWHVPSTALAKFVNLSRGETLQRGAHLPGRVWESSQSAWVRDVLQDPDFVRIPAANDTGLHSAFAFPIVHRDETLAIVELFSREIREPDEGLMNLVRSIAVQIGLYIGRKRAEEDLREEEERFRLLVEGVKDHAIIMLDAAGHVNSWNAAAQRTIGYEAAEIIGKHFSCFYPADNVERGEHERVLAVAEQEGQCLIEEGWRVRKDGSRFWAEVAVTALRSSEGSLRGFSKIIRDITERKQAEEAMAKQLKEVARSNEELQQFAFCASHDLQEPLRKVQAFGDRLRAKCGETLTDEGRDYLERMQTAAKRMQTLIENLLTFSRITTRGQPFALVDLGAVAREVLSDLEVMVEQTGARIEVGQLPSIEADPMQMRQLLQNLIGNALKFHKPGQSPIVKVHAELNDGPCKITVEDDGIGFDQKYAERIFTLFQRLHGHDKYGGTGIGLATCRKIVERHGGTITASSAPEQGAKFFITLPVKQIKIDSEK
jgi:PAS domain S-box-containing protein